MKALRNLIASLTLLIIFNQCITPGMTSNSESLTLVLNKWIGRYQPELYQHSGPPNRITSDGGNGKILIYEEFSTSTTPGRINTHQDGIAVPNTSNGTVTYSESPSITYTPPQQTTHGYRMMFYVDSEGKIYHWRYELL